MSGSPSRAKGAPQHATELLVAQIPGLRRYACALLRGDREGADDLVQDSLERALSRWHQRRADGDLRGWIYTILYHRFVTDRRRQRRDIGHRALTDILETEQPGVEGGQEGARPGLTKDGDTRSDGRGGARLGRNCSPGYNGRAPAKTGNSAGLQAL